MYRFENCAISNTSFDSMDTSCALDFDYNIHLDEVFQEHLIGEVALIPGLILAACLMDRLGRVRLIGNQLVAFKRIAQEHVMICPTAAQVFQQSYAITERNVLAPYEWLRDIFKKLYFFLLHTWFEINMLLPLLRIYNFKAWTPNWWVFAKGYCPERKGGSLVEGVLRWIWLFQYWRMVFIGFLLITGASFLVCSVLTLALAAVGSSESVIGFEAAYNAVFALGLATLVVASTETCPTSIRSDSLVPISVPIHFGFITLLRIANEQPSQRKWSDKRGASWFWLPVFPWHTYYLKMFT